MRHNQMKVTKSAQQVRFETEIYHNYNHIKNPHVTTKDATKKERFKKTLILYCRHERRLKALRRDMHRMHDSAFHGTSAVDIEQIASRYKITTFFEEPR